MWKYLLSFVLLTPVLMLNGCATVIDVVTSEPIYVHPGKRTLGAKIDDSQIETIGKVNLHKADEGLFEGRVKVTSYNGVVLITGQVETAQLRQLAGDTINKITRVRKVHNELEVGPIVPVSTRSYDTWLTTKIKSKMILNSAVPAGRVKVITENKTVFLMGMLSRHEADNATEAARTTRGVMKVVRVFEYID